jgi:tRNA(His) 5'-end guanylyltransferase
MDAPQRDPFLSVICATPLTSFWRREKNISALPGSLFPASVLGLDDQLQEASTYSARDDFPIFGPRLVRLQRYSLRQQPSKMRDLWRDMRNPLQWYTFWAVFLVGGVSILLSVLQLSLGAAQLYYAVRSLEAARVNN